MSFKKCHLRICPISIRMMIMVGFTIGFFGCEKPNTPPFAEFIISPESGGIETIFIFDATNSYDNEQDGGSLQVRWDWDSNGIWDTEYSTNKSIQHEFSESGEYSVVLEVKDAQGSSSASTKKVLVMPNLPEIEIIQTDIIDYKTVLFTIQIVSTGGGNITKCGICWSTQKNPTVDIHNFREVQIDHDTLQITLDHLQPDYRYYFRPFAMNDSGVSYGQEVTVRTAVELASITTVSVTEVSSTSAICSGKIIHHGGGHINEFGVCWSPLANPTIDDSKDISANGESDFDLVLTNLKANTQYFVKAYAINEAGVSYGEELGFITTTGIPTLITSTITEIKSTSALSGGTITNDGGLEITNHGVCWSLSKQPTLNNNHTSDGPGNGSFSSAISGLKGNSEYFVRAYATNVRGTAYGNELKFVTSPTIPTVITFDPFYTSDIECHIDGTIVSDGGTEIIRKGFCWSQDNLPTIDDQFSDKESGMGGFSLVLSNLQPNTKYYFRTYAENLIGLAYGNQISITTSPDANNGTFRDDRDSTVYPWVKIGTQIWMAKNMAYLPKVFPRTYKSTTLRHYYVYSYGGFNIEEAKSNYFYDLYCALYNWTAAADGNIGAYQTPSEIKGICPKGWHLPNSAEWTSLLDYLGEETAEKIKSQTGWSYDRNGSNSSGFSALPSGKLGVYNDIADFGAAGDYAYFWTSNRSTTENQTHSIMIDPWKSDVIHVYSDMKNQGLSVRCVKNLGN